MYQQLRNFVVEMAPNKARIWLRLACVLHVRSTADKAMSNSPSLIRRKLSSSRHPGSGFRVWLTPALLPAYHPPAFLASAVGTAGWLPSCPTYLLSHLLATTRPSHLLANPPTLLHNGKMLSAVSGYLSGTPLHCRGRTVRSSLITFERLE